MTELKEIRSLPIWSPSFTKRGKVKAPYFDIDKPDAHMPYEDSINLQAKLDQQHSLFRGVMPSLDDPYIYLDVDVDPDPETNKGKKHSQVSLAIMGLLDKFPTYVEISPSGHGLHIIFKLSARDHETCRQLKLSRLSCTNLQAPMTGELMFSSSYLIITETPYFTPQSPIATISLEDLALFYPALTKKLNPTKSAEVIGLQSKQRLRQAPDINDMRDRLLKLPAKMNFYTERAYSNLVVPMQPNTYEHWVMVAMCLAHSALQTRDAAIVNEYFLLFDEWSQTDEDSYVSQADTFDKWESCLASTAKKVDSEENYIPALTKSTLHKLVNLCYPQYEVVTDKNVPLWESTLNIEEAIRFHGLSFKADAYNFDSLYAECHADAAARIFNDSFLRHTSKPGYVIVFLKDINISLRKVLEASAYPPPAISKCLVPMRSIAVQEVDFDTNKNVHDRFQAFIDEKAWDGVPRVQDTINTLKFDPHTSDEILAHYNKGLYKCLLWLVGIRYHGVPASAPAVPILVGGEGIYKSTWVKSLMHDTPFALQYVRPISGLMTDRKELTRALQNTLIALIDEIETSMKSADKAKDILTEETLSLRAHYTNSYVNVMKRGLLFGTTNNPYMNTSDDGNRRMFRITVQKCATDELWQIDMQQVFAELKHDYMGFVEKGVKMPWVFTHAENQMNNLIASGASTASEDSLLLHEFFGGAPADFELDVESICGSRGKMKQNKMLLDEGHVTTVRKLTNELVEYLQEQNFNVPVRAPNAAVIRRKLQSYAAKYTHSEHKTVIIGGQQVLNGIVTLKKQTLYIVPPRRG